MGNNNTLQIKDSQVMITVNGNQNRFVIVGSNVQMTINGNNNLIEGRDSQLAYGFNGNNNKVMQHGTNQNNVMFCNGLNNVYPQPQQPNRNNTYNRPYNSY